MKKLLALTAALILLCGSACAGYKGDILEIVLFEVWLKEAGYKGFSGPIEEDGYLIYALQGMWIGITIENNAPIRCTIHAEKEYAADALLVCYLAAISFADKRCDIMDIYREYRLTGSATGHCAGDWYCVIKDMDDGKLSVNLVKV